MNHWPQHCVQLLLMIRPYVQSTLHVYCCVHLYYIYQAYRVGPKSEPQMQFVWAYYRAYWCVLVCDTSRRIIHSPRRSLFPPPLSSPIHCSIIVFYSITFISRENQNPRRLAETKSIVHAHVGDMSKGLLLLHASAVAFVCITRYMTLVGLFCRYNTYLPGESCRQPTIIQFSDRCYSEIRIPGGEHLNGSGMKRDGDFQPLCGRTSIFEKNGAIQDHRLTALVLTTANRKQHVSF